MERGTILCDGPNLLVEHLPEELAKNFKESPLSGTSSALRDSAAQSTGQASESMVKISWSGVNEISYLVIGEVGYLGRAEDASVDAHIIDDPGPVLVVVGDVADGDRQQIIQQEATPI